MGKKKKKKRKKEEEAERLLDEFLFREQIKSEFHALLWQFVDWFSNAISQDNKWTIRGLIDGDGNVFSLSTDTKVISSVFELQIFPIIRDFLWKRGYYTEPASRQNWYPDLTCVSRTYPDVKFAVDVKSTYRDENDPNFCNGFTLGSHGKYFADRASNKNIQYPYQEYKGHFCIGIIYSRLGGEEAEKKRYRKIFDLKEVRDIPAVIGNFTFFAQEKWRIASDRQGSGNTANIGSVTYIPDLENGNGVFARAGEGYFDDYWRNFATGLSINGTYYPYRSFAGYLRLNGLPQSLDNPPKTRRRR